jgi:hypothetical protein
MVTFVRWSSDSLAREVRIQGARVSLLEQLTQTFVAREANSFTATTLSVALPDERATYRLRVDYLGVRPADTTIILRQGYTDTARVFLQSGRMVCS